MRKRWRTSPKFVPMTYDVPAWRSFAALCLAHVERTLPAHVLQTGLNKARCLRPAIGAEADRYVCEQLINEVEAHLHPRPLNGFQRAGLDPDVTPPGSLSQIERLSHEIIKRCDQWAAIGDAIRDCERGRA